MSDTVLFSYRDDLRYLHHTVSEFPDPNEFPSHSHNMAELYFFIDGEAQFAVEGSVYDLSPGTVIVTAHGQAHHLILSPGCRHYERIAVLFEAPPKAFSLLHDGLVSGSNRFLLNERERVLFEEGLNAVSHSKESMRGVLTDSLANLIFASLAKKDTSSSLAEHDIVKDTIVYINEHLSENLSLDVIAKAMFSNKSYINKRFNAIMGCTVWDYIIRKRVFAAQQKLYIAKSVSEAFAHSGFNDYSTFFRAYKKCTGLSPSDDLDKHK